MIRCCAASTNLRLISCQTYRQSFSFLTIRSTNSQRTPERKKKKDCFLISKSEFDNVRAYEQSTSPLFLNIKCITKKSKGKYVQCYVNKCKCCWIVGIRRNRKLEDDELEQNTGEWRAYVGGMTLAPLMKACGLRCPGASCSCFLTNRINRPSGLLTH